MKSFLKYMLATIVGVLISTFLVSLIFIIIVSSMVSSVEKETVIKSNSVLQLTFSKEIPERTNDNPFKHISLNNFKPEITVGLTDIVKCIQSAKYDDNIKGIYLDLAMVPTGYANIEEIRNALFDFKTSGKFVFAYADFYTQKSYYLATAADSIFLNPAGEILFSGLSTDVLFYKGMLDKLDIEAEVIRHGKFKSAVEPFITDKMSPENREQISGLLNSVWGHVISKISEKRHISADSLNLIADNLLVTSAVSAAKYHFVDTIIYKDEILSRLVKRTGVASEKKLEFVSLSDYFKAPKTTGTYEKNKIALVYAEGEIGMGESDDESIGSETLSKAIRDARSDTSIKAIVLRINSPGGSALASEVIWRELTLAKKQKPVIVSMGALAASGGYYIAVPADTIVAEPTTITGSIGVFGLMINAKGFLNNKLGITSEMVSTNKHGNIGTPFRPLTEEEKQIIQAEIENIYDQFISHVADGRKLTKEHVDSIGQGRVWSALDAINIGLVDKIGTLKDAISIAANNAKLKEYRVISYPKQESSWTSLFSGISSQMQQNAINKELGENAVYYHEVKNLVKSNGIQMRMPFSVSVY